MISKVFTMNLVNPSRIVSFKPMAVYRFSERTWKERDEAAERVYITQSEKLAMKKLLEKMNEQGYQKTAKLELFENKLEEILAKHKVSNQAFKVEVLHLHKEL